jgi:integrase
MAWVSKYRTKDKRTTYKVGWRDPSGKTHKKTFRLRREADDFARIIEGDKVRGDYFDPKAGRITLADYWEQFMTTATHLKPSSRHLYEDTATRYILPALGHFPLRSIEASDVRGFLATLAHKPATARIAHRLLRSVLYSAVEDKKIRYNPAAKAKLPAERRREARYLTADEVDQLAQEVPELYRALVYLLAYSGLRIGEAAALRVEDIDFLRGRVHVRRNSVEVGGRLIEGTPKGGANRVVSIPPHVVGELSRCVKDFKQRDGRMFGHEYGSPIPPVPLPQEDHRPGS